MPNKPYSSQFPEFNFSGKLLQSSFKPHLDKIFRGEALEMPAVVELDPTTSCDMQCPYCISSSILKNKLVIPFEILLKLLDDLKAGGTKSIILIGGGEPLLHPNTIQILEEIKKRDFKLGITTNGTQLNKYSDKIAECADWIRVSLNSAFENSHSRTNPKKNGNPVFRQIISAMQKIVSAGTCKVGWSFIIISLGDLNNINEIIPAAEIAENTGCNYIEYKPLMHLSNHDVHLPDRVKLDISDKLKTAKTKETKNFRVLFSNSLSWILEGKKKYRNFNQRCNFSELRTVITPSGCYICLYHRGNERFSYGKITKTMTFKKLWNSSKRKRIVKAHNIQSDCSFYCIRKETNNTLESWKRQGLPEISYNTNDPFI